MDFLMYQKFYSYNGENLFAALALLLTFILYVCTKVFDRFYQPKLRKYKEKLFKNKKL